jgi:excisionase family DNA binding protein
MSSARRSNNTRASPNYTGPEGGFRPGQEFGPQAAQALFSQLSRLIDHLPLDQIPAILAALSAMAGAASARILGSEDAGDTPAEAADENLSIEEAARRLGVSKDYLYRHAKKLPFTRRIGRRLLFSARGLERWNRRRAPLDS